MPWFTVTTARQPIPLSEVAFFLLAAFIILFAGVMIGIGWVAA